MSDFLYKNPLTPEQLNGAQSVTRTETFGTNFSVLGIGGFMEVYNITDLYYTIPPATTGPIEISGNTIPISFLKGSGTPFSPDVLTLNSDNISSGRRRLGMLVYVYETDQVYQYQIDNFYSLWSAATGSTGIGGNTVVFSDFGTTVKNNSLAGQNFINAWTANTIDGISGNVRSNSVWKKYHGTNLAITGGSYNSFTGTLNLVNITGGTVPITGISGGGGGGGITGGTFNLSNGDLTLSSSAGTITVPGFLYGSGTTNTLPKYVTSSGFTDSQITDDGSNVTIGGNLTTISADLLVNQGITATTISATTYYNLPIDPDSYVTGFTLNSNIITLSQNRNDQYSAFTISLSAYTGGSVSGAYLPLSGGTVTGNTTFTSGLTVNYIDFDTTPNVPAPTGGTVYFDSNENALSYKPITPSNDVTVNLGQESLVRIYNNLGTQINNGQALHITGATSGSPTVSLAIGTGGDSVQFQISGIATHDIPNLSYGFMTVFGVVRDINLTGFTVGEQVYLSQTVAGGFSSYSGLSFTGRTCEVGHVIDNSALGKLQVTILNEIEGTIITTQENNILAANNSSTGVFQFSGLSIDTPSGTTFSVGEVEGWIIDNTTSPTNPTIKLIIYSGATGITATNVTSATETYILLTSGLTITQQTTFPTPQQRRQNLYLGKFGHANKQYLINAFNEPDSSLSPVSQLRDMFTSIKLINEGIYPSANGANLNINTSAGVLYGLGLGYITNKLNPNSLSVSGTSPCTFQYRTQTGGTAANTTLIIPGDYDNNGVVTAVGGGSNSSTNQRIYLVQNGQFRIQYGQQVYGSLAAAIEASQNEAFTTFSNFRDNAILIGILSVNKNATNLSDIAQARFLLTSKFGETVGAAGGISTTNLQQAYNNSATPEIVTNSAEGALSIQNGTGNADNVTNLFEGRNTAASTTSFIRADGAFSGTSIFGTGLTATTVSATTYLNLPSATFTGGTVSGPTNFTNGLTANTISATTYQNLPSFNYVQITGTTQFSAGTNNNLNFSGINMTITSGSNNTLIFSAGTGGGGGTTVTGGTYSAGTLTINSSDSSSVSITEFPSSTYFGVSVDGSGGVITTGQKGYVKIPYNFTITAWTIIGTPSGTLIFDVWKANNTLPTVANTIITGGTKPTLSGSTLANSSSVSGWNVNGVANDIIGWNVDSATTVTNAVLQIYVTRIN